MIFENLNLLLNLPKYPPRILVHFSLVILRRWCLSDLVFDGFLSSLTLLRHAGVGLGLIDVGEIHCSSGKVVTLH